VRASPLCLAWHSSPIVCAHVAWEVFVLPVCHVTPLLPCLLLLLLRPSSSAEYTGYEGYGAYDQSAVGDYSGYAADGTYVGYGEAEGEDAASIAAQWAAYYAAGGTDPGATA
jgi:hypothetical protein